MPRRYQTIIQNTVDPAGGDNAYELGQQWINTTTGNIFFLKSIVVGVATWVDVTNASALTAHPSVRLATTAADGDINLASFAATIDGGALGDGDRVLIKNQTTLTENGIYVYTLATTDFARAADMVTDPGTFGGDFVFVEEGTLNSNTGWVVSGAGTVDVDDMVWYQFSAAGTYTGTQLGGGSHVFKQLSGTAFEFRSIIGEADRLVVTQNADDLTLTLSSKVVCTDKDNDWGSNDQTFDTDLLVIKQATNRIGINKAAPAVELDVVGSAAISGGMTVDTATLVVDPSNDRVGINVAAPLARLHVVHNSGVDPSASWNTDNGTMLITNNTTSQIAIGVQTNSRWHIWIQGKSNGSLPRSIVINPVTDESQASDYNRGCVGVGTPTGTTHLGILHVRTTGTVPPVFENYTGDTTLPHVCLKLLARTTSAGANTFGPRLSFQYLDSTGTTYTTGAIDAVRNGADNNADLVLSSSSGGSLIETVRLSRDGKVGVAGMTAPTSHLHVNGSFANEKVAYSNSTPITLDDTYFVLIINKTTGAQTVNLPLASTCKGRIYIIKSLNSYVTAASTINRSGADTIDGATSISMTYLSCYILMSDGVSAWGRIAQYDA